MKTFCAGDAGQMLHENCRRVQLRGRFRLAPPNAGQQPRPKGVGCLPLFGVLFRCADGHEWESAVGGVWLQMPWCPECERTKGKRLPAVAWIGKWDTPNAPAVAQKSPPAGGSARDWPEDFQQEKRTMVRVYLGGPMSIRTGADDRDEIPERRLLAFDALEAWARRQAGHWLPLVDWEPTHAVTVFNPAAAFRGNPLATRTVALRLDLHFLLDAHLAFFLPGYEQSRGCAAELFVCHWLRIPAYRATPPIGTFDAHFHLEAIL